MDGPLLSKKWKAIEIFLLEDPFNRFYIFEIPAGEGGLFLQRPAPGRPVVGEFDQLWPEDSNSHRGRACLLQWLHKDISQQDLHKVATTFLQFIYLSTLFRLLDLLDLDMYRWIICIYVSFYCGFWSNRTLLYFPLSVLRSFVRLTQAWHINFFRYFDGLYHENHMNAYHLGW